MIKAKIIADSINPAGVRLTSWILKYPRFIHSEFMTHRVFSRNAASSRAIPFSKMMAAVEDEPAFPERWGAEQRGMQSGEDIENPEILRHWQEACLDARLEANALHNLGLHKSICNRLLEPFAHMTVLATATDHVNFFRLRAHPAAQPEFQVLAYRMLKEYLAHAPERKETGEWHVPFGDRMPEGLDGETKRKVAVARCARLSYLTFDQEIDVAKDLELYARLKESGHWSPFEHVARAVDPDKVRVDRTSNFDSGVRFSCWEQLRKTEERISHSELRITESRPLLAEILAAKPEWISL